MIIRTYEDWFCDYSLKWDVRDYLEVVEISNCVQTLGKYLEVNETNIVTKNNVHFFDLGDKPSTYNPKKTESEQIFIIPASKYPEKIVFRYSDWKPFYRVTRLPSKYKQSNLKEKGISE